MESQTRAKVKPAKVFFASHTPPNVNEELAPIIFIHGLGATNRSWNSVKFEISEKTQRKTFVLDLRNHGYSEWCEGFSLDHIVADVEHFMETEHIPKAVLVAHSIGGRAAIVLAFRKPEMVEKLVIEDTALKDTQEEIEAFKKGISFMKAVKHAFDFLPANMSEVDAQKKLMGYMSKQWPHMFGNSSVANASMALPFHKGEKGKFVIDVNFNALLEIEKDFESVKIDLSQNPVYNGHLLLIGGDKSDFFKKTDVDLFFKHFPNFQNYFFENGYHNLHIEFPEKYIEIVSNFIGV